MINELELKDCNVLEIRMTGYLRAIYTYYV